MGFGLSFGSSKQKSSTTENKNETTTQQQASNSNTQANTTANTNTAQTGSTANTGTSATNQTQTNVGTTQQTGAQTGVTQNFDSTTLAGLQSLVQQLTGSAGAGAANDTLSSQVANLGKFNAEDYVAGVKSSAQATADQNLDSAIGTTQAGIGGTESTNSAAALLGNRLRTDSASSVAGQVAQAQQTAAGISQGNVAAAQGAVNSQQSFLSTLLDALKGGTATTTATSTGGTTTSGTSNTSGSTSTNEAGTSASNTDTGSTSNVSTIIDQLLNGTSTDIGTDSSTTTGKKSGGGFSLGF